jgi:hypothetical protein
VERYAVVSQGAMQELRAGLVIVDLRLGVVTAPHTLTEDPSMTDEMTTPKALPEKTADSDLLREMSGFTAKRPMVSEVEGLTGADRVNQGHGYRDQVREIRPGAVEPRLPKLREGGYVPG